MINKMRATAGLISATLALSFAIDGDGARLASPAHAQNMLQNMLTKLRGERLPAGIAKSNGRLEATQVDISSKYAGRLASVDVEEGSTVTQGQTVAKISAPEMEAQLRSAEASAQKAQRCAGDGGSRHSRPNRARYDFAKSEYERGAELVKSGDDQQADLRAAQAQFRQRDLVARLGEGAARSGDLRRSRARTPRSIASRPCSPT